MATCSVDGWRNRQGAKWYPTSGFKSIGVSTGASLFIASNPSGNNKYTIVLRVKTPNDAGIASITSLTVNFRIYKANNNAGTLYGSLRTKYDDLGSGDTASTFRTNAIGSEVSKTGLTTSWSSQSMTFSGTFAKNTYYYLVLYSKSNSDMYYTTVDGLQPSATCATVATTYTVSYNANGGTGAPGNQTKTHGETLTLSTTKPTKANGSNTVSGSFVITGDANGGVFSNSATTTTITATTSTPQTIKYTFSKWKDSNGNEYSAGGSYTTNASTTMTAQYTSTTTNGTTSYTNNAISALAKPTRANSTVATYTITFDSNGGSSCSNKSADKTRVFTFSGWATSASATSANASATYTAKTTVYAYWTHTDSTGTITLPAPTKNGYTFLGWATTADAKTADVGTGNYEPSGNITLYAVWGLNNSLIHYNDNGNDVLCAVYINDNGTAVLCNVYYNDNGTAVRI